MGPPFNLELPLALGLSSEHLQLIVVARLGGIGVPFERLRDLLPLLGGASVRHVLHSAVVDLR